MDAMKAEEGWVPSRKEREASTHRSPPGRAVYKYNPNMEKRVFSDPQASRC